MSVSKQVKCDWPGKRAVANDAKTNGPLATLDLEKTSGMPVRFTEC
jgi:hypothetical protein